MTGRTEKIAKAIWKERHPRKKLSLAWDIKCVMREARAAETVMAAQFAELERDLAEARAAGERQYEQNLVQIAAIAELERERDAALRLAVGN
jgi:hypothetical protein